MKKINEIQNNPVQAQQKPAAGMMVDINTLSKFADGLNKLTVNAKMIPFITKIIGTLLQKSFRLLPANLKQPSTIFAKALGINLQAQPQQQPQQPVVSSKDVEKYATDAEKEFLREV